MKLMIERLKPIHLERHQHYVTCEITAIWCDATEWMRDGNATTDLDQCTCLLCLEEVGAFAKLAHKRWTGLVPHVESYDDGNRSTISIV